MKKIFLILFIFIPFIFIDNVDALTFEKCGETIQVDNSNYIYYLYNRYKSEFNDNSIFVFYRSSSTNYNLSFIYDNNGFEVFYNQKWGARRLRFLGSSNKTYSIYGPNGSLNTYNNSTQVELLSFNDIYSSINYSQFEYNRQGSVINLQNINSNISLSDLKQYFTCTTPLYPETKNIIFTNFILDFSRLVPYIIVFVLIFEGVGWFINKKD